MRIDTLLIRRLVFGVLSGIGVGLLFVDGQIFDWPAGAIVFYAASGLVFAAGVLFPCLVRENRVLLRALALTIGSSLSYYTAVWLAIDAPFGDGNSLLSFTIASVAGVAIVMTALVLATRVRASGAYVPLGLIAGIIGGPVTHATLSNDTVAVVLAGYVVWHVLVCLAIYFGTGTPTRTDAP